MLKPIKVILTCAGGLESVGKIESLKYVKERKVTVIGTDMEKDAPGTHVADKFYTVPSGDSPDYIDAMMKIAKKEDVDVILPASQNEIISLSKYRALFEKIGTVVACSNHESIVASSDKGLLYEFLRKRGLPHPKFYNVSDIKNFESAVAKLGYPAKQVVMKPRLTSGSRGFRIIKSGVDEKELLLEHKPADNVYASMPEMVRVLGSGKFPSLVVSEYLPGKEYSIDVLARGGESLIIVPRVRDKIMHGISIAGTVEKNDEVDAIVRRIVKAFGFDYNINVQLKGSDDGRLLPYEINPRISGTIAAATGAGANLIYFGAKLALNEEIPKVNVKYGTKMIRYWREMYTR